VPNSVIIADSCYGGSLTNGNRHTWRLSEDGVSAAVFSNADSFRFCADLRVTRGFGRVGLQISPWWSPDLVGTFVVDLDYGWVVAGGGRLPYFAFIGQEYEDLPPYVRGTILHLEMIYLPNGLSQASPATIEYRVTYNSVNNTSGPLAFTEGNPADDPPYGRWGILSDARVGGYMDFDTTRSGINYLLAEWSNICFEALTVGVSTTSWSQVKQLYRDATR
jgi:hypothetical protein